MGGGSAVIGQGVSRMEWCQLLSGRGLSHRKEEEKASRKPKEEGAERGGREKDKGRDQLGVKGKRLAFAQMCQRLH